MRVLCGQRHVQGHRRLGAVQGTPSSATTAWTVTSSIIAIFAESGGAARQYCEDVEVGMGGVNVPIPVAAALSVEQLMGKGGNR
ncbi:hypothetical protein SAMN05216215_10898 [Saccharopolyspora shandongensis]|uniref:Uncharacterized protein n=1 Tax=Saccharopolyspora shandongensis TaxID=418495 RepID=A0A1H3TR01_9PSEU|nr:hypothetical protein SAMN05216215_10898 [Saccharopolyspora shandongensis]